MLDRQALDNLKGEIAFRRKLAKQHTTGEVLLPDYFAKEEHDRIMEERVKTTRRAFHELRAKGVDFSEFIELGAERGHRSLVLVNDFGAKGIALDLSLDQLLTAPHFAEMFGMPALPFRVCCDANNLPLRDGAVPFAFCYQFLHHFPSLTGPVQEIHRALGRGWFFFDEEPVGRLLQLSLYQQSAKEYSQTNLGRGKLLRWLEGFISEPASDEIEHGVIENHSMRLGHWRETLRLFDETDVRVRTLRHLKSKVRRTRTPTNLVCELLGGVIYGLAKKFAENASSGSDPALWLECPECGPERRADQSPPIDALLQKSPRGLTCTVCDASYPVVEGVPVLIRRDLRRELYPDLG